MVGAAVPAGGAAPLLLDDHDQRRLSGGGGRQMELGVEGARLGDLPAADTPNQAADRIAGPRHAAVGGGDRDRRRDQDRCGRRRLWLAAIAAQRKLRALRRIDNVGGGHFDNPADPLVSEEWQDRQSTRLNSSPY